MHCVKSFCWYFKLLWYSFHLYFISFSFCCNFMKEPSTVVPIFHFVNFGVWNFVLIHFFACLLSFPCSWFLKINLDIFWTLAQIRYLGSVNNLHVDLYYQQLLENLLNIFNRLQGISLTWFFWASILKETCQTKPT